MRDGKPVYYEAMVKKIERYVDLFKATHGGITFSGGESMMQPAFVSRVFRAAKEMACTPASILPDSLAQAIPTTC